ncbi:tRNA uridine-5-carboxymethylaminomethyl(34) synthesis GTPase MnmE [Oribacterium sp. WCC10]|uniref:tRNA uridine-5-carboxymethylaminomethyl(34) synthesis GTPase MnmE n=1 Tax=Oribacterium sp. WCC10 TaxID=1855343 RepID=UPI0008E9E69A|nr:tRNA uridine-5-carboxymethylaminomethyl(34) synthesis GTPase MnmE [Oribacterium sp. WCC10]SFG72267.1 tRNA modification GTPase [Oribacterium sp. WCC10]
MINDTICALATPAAEAGIGVIRISGPDAVFIASKLIKSKNGKSVDISETHRIKYGFIYDGDQALDEVLIMTMISPKSFTGEDTVEIDCHGGVLMMRRILEIVVKNGARLAEPGEFTKRAFLNGRIDLSEAEAVSDIISSENDFALKASINQLRGSVSEKIKHFRAIILEDDAYIEAALDDPEHITLDGFRSILYDHISEIIKDLDNLISSADDGKKLKEGIRTVILGKPNAGKSSLLNILVGSERAIVTDIEGTTRDTLEEHINIKGISLTIIDTAGIRDTNDTVEKIGVERALDAADNADLIIYVVDSSKALDDSDFKIISRVKDQQCIVLLNKSDLDSMVGQADLEKLTGKKVIPISAKNNFGIDSLESEISNMFFNNRINFNDQLIITNLRHKNCLINANQALHEVINSITNYMPEDFFTIDLMKAYEELGYILGEEVSEDLINEIFSKFCMGK